MALHPIPIDQLLLNVSALWSEQWLLLTAGDFRAGKFNTMTVGWGSFGVMWNKPFVQVVVRPTRYTYQFMEQYEDFTLCAFPETYRAALELLGSTSGREGNKIAASGLVPIPATRVSAPAFAEAELIIECRKIYWDDFKPDHFMDRSIHSNYPLKDYHRVYFGEIVAVSGVDRYRAGA